MEPIQTTEYKGHTIKIYPDDSPESPREWDNVGHMTCFHRHYDLGDKHHIDAANFDGWDAVAAYLRDEEQATVMLPLYLYDHGGITMRVGGFSGCPLPQGHREFDTMMVGFIWCTAAEIEAQWGTGADARGKAVNRLTGEVQTYDQYLRGDVYGYVVEGMDMAEIDSCWGFYGMEYAIAEAQSIVDWHIENRIKAHATQVKAWIKAGVPLVYRQPLTL